MLSFLPGPPVSTLAVERELQRERQRSLEGDPGTSAKRTDHPAPNTTPTPAGGYAQAQRLQGVPWGR